MANKKLKTIQFPGLPDTYTVPQVENGTNNNVAALDGAGNAKDSAIEVSKVAKTDGSYQNLNAGTSDQLNATVGVTDKVPYNFRTSGGSADIGNRLNDKIVGGTIAWNQMLDKSKYPATTTTNGVTFTNNGDGSITVDGTASSTANGSITIAENLSVIQGHKYYATMSKPIEHNNFWLGLCASPAPQPFQRALVILDQNGQILTCVTSSDKLHVDITLYKTASVSNVTVKPQFFDLTQMFGSTIADYIYSLEQTTAGAGVAWFKNLFPKPYYTYNTAELMSVCTNAHITRGFNAYNHANGTAKLVGGKQYQITGAYTSLAYSTGETITPDTNGLFTPTENGVLTVTGGNSSTTCVHLTWSGYRNGEYEPYVEHNYSLSPVELRGIPKLDASNHLYFDGDTYEKDGTVTRKIIHIILNGTENWTQGLGTSNEHEYYFLRLGDYDSVIDHQAICDKYLQAEINSANTVVAIDVINSVSRNMAVLMIRPVNVAGMTVEQFKALLASSPVTVEYGISTPISETANPFTDPQIVNDFGTEEYVDALATAETSPRDVAIPVGHETFYQANLRDKLQNLPVNASADGLYLVKQTGNKQELIAYTTEDELPASPAETGTYVLKLVDGTLTWVLES